MASSPLPENTDKPRGMNMYTVMLLLSFIFLLIGCIALGTELARYGFELRPGFKLL